MNKKRTRRKSIWMDKLTQKKSKGNNGDIVVENVANYLKVIDAIKKESESNTNQLFNNEGFSFIYRGQAAKKYKLIPSILRNESIIKDRTGVARANYYESFRSEAIGIVEESYSYSSITWIEVAQHFGAPTHLLDFSTNPLVALYFACEKHSKEKVNKSDGKVWIINSLKYRQKYYGKSEYSFGIENDRYILSFFMQLYGFKMKITNEDTKANMPWIYKPYYRFDRMAAQSSIFMLWGRKLDDLVTLINKEEGGEVDFVESNKNNIIKSITIPEYCKDKMLKELDELGINEKTIYPGLDGLGRYYARKLSE